jgi:hypothetical protein
MPNWCEGTLKIRGSKENIIRFAKECITGTNGWKIKSFDLKNGGYELGKNDDFNVEIDDYELYIHNTMDTHIEGTRRMFIQQENISWYWNEVKDEVVSVDVQQAWGIDVDNLVNLSKKYNLDFKIYAFEAGMQFNQDVEVIKGEVIKNQEITFDDYQWECINPNLGG